jgi:hypothetical protein
MEWTNDHLALMNRCGATMMKHEDIAIIFQDDIDEDEIIRIFLNKNHPMYKAYHKGRLLSELAVRESIFNQATNGSSPAQNLAMDMIDKLRFDQA